MANKIKLRTNAKEVSKAIELKGTEKTDSVKKQVFTSAVKIESLAKNNAPVDTGALRASITHQMKDDGFTGIVGTNKKYAPFREFGTGRKTKIPSGFSSVASQFKGSGGFPPVDKLRGWARRNGFQGLEFVLARHIFREGTKPQPFLIPAFQKESSNFEKEIEKILRKR